jgi:hypothetical protein
VRELADSDSLLQHGAKFIKDELQKRLGIEFKNRGSVNQLHDT